MLAWIDPHRREAGDDTARALAKAAAAAGDILTDYRSADKATITRIHNYLGDLKRALTYRLMGGGQGLTSFKRASLSDLLADTDRLIAQTQRQLEAFAEDALGVAGDLGTIYATAPINGAGLTVQAALPGLDVDLVNASFETTVGLLSPAMRQYADKVKQAVKRVTLAGEGQFDEIRKLSQVIGDGGDVAQFKAERIIRTEVGRVFGEATYARGLDLAKEFPFLRKGWRASKDNRTRKGHVEAGAIYVRGEGSIPFRQKFQVRVYDERPGKSPTLLGVVAMRFPIDPEATPAGRLAAGATIMCRCNAFIDFDPVGYREHSRQAIRDILKPVAPPPPPDPAPPPPAPTPPPAPPPPVVDTTIAPARRHRPAADVRKDIDALAKTAPEGAAVAAAEKRLAKHHGEAKDVTDRLRAIQDMLTQAAQADGQGNVWARVARQMDTDPEIVKLRDQLSGARKAIVDTTKARDAAKRALAARARTLVEVDAVSRPKVKAEWDTPGKADRRTIAQQGIEAFERLIGIPLPEAVRVKFIAGRSHYDMRGGIVMGNDDLGTVVHELGHWLEDKVPEVHQRALAFLIRRTAGEKIRSLNDWAREAGRSGGYRKDERSTKDGFDNPYSGKWYTPKLGPLGRYTADTPEKLGKWVQATEVVSMGLEAMYEDPVRFQQTDPDFFDFIYDLARGQSTETLPDDPSAWNHVPGLTKIEPKNPPAKSKPAKRTSKK